MASTLTEVLNAALAGIQKLDSEIRDLAKQGSGDGTDTTLFLQLQSAAANYQTAVASTSAVIKTFSDTYQGVIQKI